MKAIKSEWKIGNKGSKKELLARKKERNEDKDNGMGKGV